MDCCCVVSLNRNERRVVLLLKHRAKQKQKNGHRQCAWALLLLTLFSLLVVGVPAAAAFTPPAHQGFIARGKQGPMTTLKSETTKEWESSLSTTSRNNRNTDYTSSSSSSSSMFSNSGASLYNKQAASFAFLPLQRPDRATETLGSVLLTISTLIYVLATSDKVLFGVLRGYEHHLEKLQEMADDIIVALVPMTSGDVVSVAFGEAFAGVFSAVVWSLVIAKKLDNIKPSMSETGGGLQSSSSTMVNAVADGDFFVAKAATYPAFVATGLSPVQAGIASVSVSMIPSEMVKFGSRQRQQLVEEELELERILWQQEEEEKRRHVQFGHLEVLMDELKLPKHHGHEIMSGAPPGATASALVPVVHQQDAFIVEIFADIIKWLEYDALCNHYGGQLGLYPALEGALFGSLCAVSSQMYTDLLYIGFGVEGEARRQQLLSRTKKDWWDLYLYRILSVSTLFGIYQLVLSPFESFFESVLSGR